MVGLMISTIELIVRLSIAFFALLVRICLAALNLLLAVVSWVYGRIRRRGVGSGS